jgi:hypothetical protein
MPARSNSDLTIAQAAKIIKSALMAAFPGIIFSVRSSSFSGGQDISIHWTDGPAESRVRKIAGPYSRITRDYMTGEILSGGRYLGLSREISKARAAWAKNKTAGDQDEYAASIVPRNSSPSWGLVSLALWIHKGGSQEYRSSPRRRGSSSLEGLLLEVDASRSIAVDGG